MLRHDHLEIACDESGFTGGALAGSERVFAHASVDIQPAAAAELVAEVRAAAHSATEVKASWLLRPPHRRVLRRVLAQLGQAARVTVHLTDNRFFLLARLVDALLGPLPVSGLSCPGVDPERRSRAVRLYREGESALGAVQWQRFLVLSANLLRTNNRWLPPEPITDFFRYLGEIAPITDGGVRDVLDELVTQRSNATATRTTLLDDRTGPPLLEPLLPALTCAVLRWGSTTRSLSIVHDEQSAITPFRIAAMARSLDERNPGHRVSVRSRADSRTDPRIQVADWVAGTARRAAGSVFAERLDPELIEFLAPVVDADSVWPQEILPLAAATRIAAALGDPGS